MQRRKKKKKEKGAKSRKKHTQKLKKFYKNTMFDGGVPDQFHQFIASRSSISLPISFPHHHGVAVVSSSSTTTSSPAPVPVPSFAGGFESYPSQAVLFPPLPPSHHHHQSRLQQLQQPPPPPLSSVNKADEVKEEASSTRLLISRNLVLERDRSVKVSSDHSIEPWTNDEVLALLRIRSSLENWVPDFTWEHVSRKLADVGFQKSAEKCKEKFEEESRHFSNMSYNKSNYRFFSDLDEIYHGENPQPQISAVKTPSFTKENEKEVEEEVDHNMEEEEAEEDAGNATVEKPFQENIELEKELIMCRKRKRKHKFEMFKGFCEAIVKKIIAQQEELHNKLIEDMIRRDEESIAREEAWKNQEIERINKEIERRAQEQAIAGGRQAKIIEFLKKFTSDFIQDQNFVRKIQDLLKVTNGSSSATASCEILPQSINITTCEQVSNPTFLQTQNLPTSSSETTPSPHNHNTISVRNATFLSMVSENPNESTATKVQANIPAVVSNPSSSVPKFSHQTDEKGERDIGKRWPRDEVLALINLRCSLNNNNNNEDNKDASSKGPLWERISQMMLELGYKRSAKRCKEKWENINKYFRKTKDNKKKRSMDSRTCPYFHQLSNLYSQGTLVGPPSHVPENH